MKKRTYVDLLTELSEAEEGVLLEFLLKYKFDNKDVHYLFEGYEDPSYYLHFIEQFISNPMHTYIGNGKYKLFNIYDSIDWNVYDKNRVLVFTDRDYSELLGEDFKESEPNVYTTDFYSIENHIIDSCLIKKVLREIYHLTDEGTIEELTAKYLDEYQAFFKGSLYLFAWIIFMRKSKIKVHLDSIDLGELFDVTTSQLKFSCSGGLKYDYLEKVTGTRSPDGVESEIKKLIQEIKNHNPKNIIRGKFEVWFLIRFLMRLKEKHQLNGQKLKINTQLNQNNCVEILASRSIIPESLQKFLRDASQRLIAA